MGTLNVNRSVSDVFYRYKMPRLMAKVEGKGNGIKTVIVNMMEVAKALGRPPTYPTKYFGCELGAQTQFDFKNERFIVNGSHDAAKLQDLLDGFIKKFVLCPECDNPETDLSVSTKRSTISQACKACGYHGVIESTHKLLTFILKNPPSVNPAVQGSSLTEGKRTKRGNKKIGGKDDGNTTGGGVSGSNDTADEASTSAILEVSSVTSGDTSKATDFGETEDDTEWAVDVSEEAVRARMQDLTDGAKNMTLNDDLEKSEKERMDIFYNHVKTKKSANLLTKPQTAIDLLNTAERLDIKPKAPLVLIELLFDDKMRQQIDEYRLLFMRFTHDDLKAQRYFMGGFEQVIGLHRDALINKVPILLKHLYDLDVLSESAIIAWSEKVSKKYVTKEVSQLIHEKAAPFVKWLQEADTESEEISDDDENSDNSDANQDGDEIVIEYYDRASMVPLNMSSVVNNKNSLGKNKNDNNDIIGKNQDEDDGVEDVDIDAI